MTSNRIDQLLEEALESGAVPAGASATERVEVEKLLAAAGTARTLRAAAQAESGHALPTARARFQRFMAAETAASVPVSRPVVPGSPRRGLLARALAVHRGLTLAGSAVVIGLVALVAVIASQSYGGVDTASAQVLNVNDYAQLQGVITATSGEGAARTATLSSDFGEIEIGLGDLNAVTNADHAVDPSTLKPGDSVTVAGTVAKDSKTTKIAARTLSVLKADAKPPAKTRLTLLRELRNGLEGRITVLAVAQDGKSARVLVAVSNGEQFVVAVNAKTLGELLNGSEAAVGRSVVVSQEPGNASGEFSLTPVSNPGQPTPVARPALSGVAGIILARDGNVLRLHTDRGPVQVVVTLETRIVIGPGAELTAERFRGGNLALGHAVVIQGGVDRATGRLIADVIWVGAKPTR